MAGLGLYCNNFGGIGRSTHSADNSATSSGDYVPVGHNHANEPATISP